MNSEYDISIIIVNYNGRKYLDSLFDSISQQKCDGFSFEVVFVDNNSTDDSVEYLSKKILPEKFHLNIVKSEKNLGFAGGNNLGVEKSKGKYIAFLNNDTFADECWLSNLYHYFISHDYGIVNSKLIFFYDFVKLSFMVHNGVSFSRQVSINGKQYQLDTKFCKNVSFEFDFVKCLNGAEIYLPLVDGITDYTFEFTRDFLLVCDTRFSISDGSTLKIKLSKEQIEKGALTFIQNAGSFITKNYDGGDICFCEPDSEKFSKDYEIASACGAAMMLKKEDFLRVGGFDERFFMYYEDSDLSFRIKKLGKKLSFCHSALVRHVHAGSSKEWSPFFIYHVYRNKALFIYKNISKIYALYLIFRGILGGIRHKDKLSYTAMSDALKILLGKKNIMFSL